MDWVKLLSAVFVGALLGAGAHTLGVEYSCPDAGCVDSAKVRAVNDRQYFGYAKNAISSAKETIYMAAFEVKYYRQFPDSLQNQLVRELIYARERGVEVFVVVDEFSRENNAYDILQANNVSVRMDCEHTTTHTKLIIVDGERVLVGSTNFSYYGLEKNHEANVYVEDRDLASAFTKYFFMLWDEEC